jgi:hypothetical protein
LADGYVLLMTSPEDFTEEERTTAGLVKAVRSTGNLRPLVAVLRQSDGGPERARDALLMLGELDLDLLVQVALDTLIDDHLEDPALAPQTRRAARGQEDRTPPERRTTSPAPAERPTAIGLGRTGRPRV